MFLKSCERRKRRKDRKRAKRKRSWEKEERRRWRRGAGGEQEELFREKMLPKISKAPFSPSKGISGLPCGSARKEFSCNAGDLGSIPGLGRSPGKGKCYPLQYSALENSMDCIVHGVAKESDTTE